MPPIDTPLLDGRKAIVTGSAQGIGLAIARAFANHGSSVVIADINAAAAVSAAEEIASSGAAAIAVRCDVTDEGEVEDLVEICKGEFGRVDVMVNNAGITRDAIMRKMSPREFNDVIDVHVFGTWLGTRAASLIMREQGSGSIINMSSISGKSGNLGQTNYSAAKAAVVGLTKAAAKELGRYGVRVNVLQPGLIRSAMTEAMPSHAWQAKLAEIPMERPGEPEEVAGVAVFLASDLSSYVNGATIEITGGRQ
ncbi:MAG: 3-oxoacyl-ACP reductase FabG [Acidimicrobiia bacterium]